MAPLLNVRISKKKGGKPVSWVTVATGTVILVAIAGPMFLVDWSNLPPLVRYELWVGDAIALVGAFLWLAFG